MYSLWYRLGRLLIVDDVDKFKKNCNKDRAFPINPKSLGNFQGHQRRYIFSRYEVGELNRIIMDHEDDLKILKRVIQRFPDIETAINWKEKDDCVAVIGCCCMDWIRREEIYRGPKAAPRPLISDFGPFEINNADGIVIRNILKQKKAGSEVDVYSMMADFDKQIWFSPCSTGETNAADFNYTGRPKYHHKH